MFDNNLPAKDFMEKAVLIAVDTGGYDTEASLDELTELAKTAGADVAGRFVQKLDSPVAATLLGSGKLQEIKQFCGENEVELLLFDHELSATQIKNIESITSRSVVDRTMLILDIFAQRALTREGKLQVELAQQKYILPRLIGLGRSMSRLGGGIGTRGPGESKLEADRRHIRRRIDSLSSQLAELEKRRGFARSRRKKDGVLIVAIVGYTNAGKSTLFNALTDAGVTAENKLFATLDLTSRSMELPDGRQIILIDTVGFIRRLPHHLVEAFHSTMEEAVTADVILNVCDASGMHAGLEAKTQLEVTENLLAELGLSHTPIITVYNKCDMLAEPPAIARDNAVAVSALTCYGFDKLKKLISENLPDPQEQMTLKIPYDKSGVVSQLRENGKVLSEKFAEDGLIVNALVNKKMVRLVSGYRI